MKNWFFVLAFFFAFVLTTTAEPSEKLINALIQQESKGNDAAVGDKNLRNKAYGCLQIRQPCVDDVNLHYGTKHKAEECLGNRKLSIWVFKQYVAIYATEKRLGHKPTDEDYSRIWNGGPNGHTKESTVRYWTSVNHLMR